MEVSPDEDSKNEEESLYLLSFMSIGKQGLDLYPMWGGVPLWEVGAESLSYVGGGVTSNCVWVGAVWGGVEWLCGGWGRSGCVGVRNIVECALN